MSVLFRITGTPSPLSPTPSPSGSVGSVGSNGSNEAMTTPSRNNKASSATGAMTSPVNVCIPQKIHLMTQQHVLQVNNLVYSQDTWDQAQPVILEFRGKMLGPITVNRCCKQTPLPCLGVALALMVSIYSQVKLQLKGLGHNWDHNQPLVLRFTSVFVCGFQFLQKMFPQYLICSFALLCKAGFCFYHKMKLKAAVKTLGQYFLKNSGESGQLCTEPFSCVQVVMIFLFH